VTGRPGGRGAGARRVPHGRRPGAGAARSREYELAGGVAFRRIEGQSLLLAPGDETLYTLNGTGELVWALLVKGVAARRIVDRVAARYGLARAAAAADVAAFLAQLEARGIARRMPPAGA
jgi:hypothetical protein